MCWMKSLLFGGPKLEKVLQSFDQSIGAVWKTVQPWRKYQNRARPENCSWTRMATVGQVYLFIFWNLQKGFSLYQEQSLLDARVWFVWLVGNFCLKSNFPALFPKHPVRMDGSMDVGCPNIKRIQCRASTYELMSYIRYVWFSLLASFHILSIFPWCFSRQHPFNGFPFPLEVEEFVIRCFSTSTIKLSSNNSG